MFLQWVNKYHNRIMGNRRKIPQKKVKILEVGIDDSGRIFVRPADADYAHIYRAAKSVYWDSDLRQLHSPIPKKLTLFQWYVQILNAVFDEYGVTLALTDKTVWSDVGDELRLEIEAV